MSEVSSNNSLRIWLNGRLYDDPAEAVVPATDHGVVVGNGIFETLRVTDAGVFAITRHLNRLSRSARALGFPDPDHRAVRRESPPWSMVGAIRTANSGSRTRADGGR